MATPPPLDGPITFVGDAHGKVHRIPAPGHPVIQVSDLGLGFIHRERVHHKVTKRDDLCFVRGNHDDPSLCRSNPRYLGEFGQSSDGLFWMSGAWSIDCQFRQEGVSWWREEELTTSQLGEAFDCYVAAKPRVVVTHEGPASMFREGGEMEISNYHETATAKALEAMREAHQPDLWIFGHHHVSRDFDHEGTRFRCLAELEAWTVDF